MVKSRELRVRKRGVGETIWFFRARDDLRIGDEWCWIETGWCGCVDLNAIEKPLKGN
jgi:hypothetical protein